MEQANKEGTLGNLLDKERGNRQIRTYKRRWIILFMYTIYNALGSFQWISYSSITNLITQYYGVSSMVVDWTSISYNAIYPLFVIPASYIIDRDGLRTAGVIGCTLTCIGTTLKVFSFDRNRFYVIQIGQVLLAIANVLVACLPSKLAAVWFGSNEITIACSLGVFGSQIGVALGYIVPAFIVHNHDNPELIGEGLRHLTWILSIIIVPVTLGVIFYFPSEPPLPPSITQSEIRETKYFSNKTFLSTLKSLSTNKSFIILMIAYGINIGVYSAVSTLLNQLVLQYYKDSEADVGKMGFFMVFAGLIGAVVFSIILDKTHKFKLMSLVIYMCSIISMLSFMYALESKKKSLTFLACSLVGFFTTAFMPVGFEYGMELTYPAEESTTSGLLMSMTQAMSVVFTIVLGILNKEYGCFRGLFVQVILLVIGAVVSLFVPSNLLLRQEALDQMNGEMKRIAHHRSSHLIYIQ